jgi:phosphatidylglycerol---prolipoprotein diacylglyceryl transferase
MNFPFHVRFGPWIINAHFLFEGLAYATAFRVYQWLRKKHGDILDDSRRWWIVAVAAVGALLGGRVLALLENPGELLSHWNELYVLAAGKTIVGALIGGLFAVELVKKHLGITRRTGDLFAVPLCVGIAVGRIGCFLEGLGDRTYGIATSLPWGVNFGDGILRHPTQLYEIVFTIMLGGFLLRRMSRPHVEGDIFKLFMVSYFTFRLLCDFLKPDYRVLFGLSSIQWACVAMIVYYGPDIRRWVLPASESDSVKPVPIKEGHGTEGLNVSQEHFVWPILKTGKKFTAGDRSALHYWPPRSQQE